MGGGRMKLFAIRQVMSVIAVVVALAGCGGGGGGGGGTTTGTAEYSNSTLNGSWLILIPSMQNKNVYAIFDGVGGVLEFGGIKALPGTYSVQSNGSLSMTLNFVSDPSETFTGSLTSSTTGNISAFGTTLSLVKVSDVSACEGTWTGNLSEQNGGSALRPITVAVNSNGAITSVSGLLPPVSGRMFTESGNLAAKFKTGESDAYSEFRFVGTKNANTISGSFETNGLISGTFLLSKQ